MKAGLFSKPIALAVFATLAAAHAIAASGPTEIDVFVHGAIATPSIPNTHITVINVREAEEINEQAPQFHFDPNDPQGQAVAEQKVMTWAKSPAGKAHRLRLRQSWNKVEHLFNCGIEKVPAIAFERCTYVIYGTTDVVKAVQDYDEFKRTGR